MNALPFYEDSVSVVTNDLPPKVVMENRCKDYLVFEGVEIPCKYDMCEVLEELSECDGYGSYYLFSDNLGGILEKAGLVERTARGGYYSTDLFKEVYNQLYEKAKSIAERESNISWEPTEENIQALPEPIKAYILELQAKAELKS